MMRCDSSRLSRYLDSEMSLPEMRRTEQHLAVCIACTAELESLRAVDRTVREWGAHPVPIPVETERRISAALRRRDSRRVGVVNRMMPAAVGTTLAALIVSATAGWGMLTPRHAAQPLSVTPKVTRQIARQSAPMVAARRTNALVGMRTATLLGERAHGTFRLSQD